MKKITLLVTVLILCPFIWAQNSARLFETVSETDVPPIVVDAQSYLFPNSFVDEWKLQRDTANKQLPIRYISKFRMDGQDGYTASYLDEGTPIFHSQFMMAQNIPETVLLKAQYDQEQYEIVSADFMTLYATNLEVYRVKLRDNAMEKRFFYDINGNKIAEESLPEELILFEN
ncbi:hypothetical protein [Aequorivita echinoideorum]|uniref:Beta-lactamase-inhibitor-like, PepSY-like n=1 Tax=Aequorivita echinoideorum TaxID=1549647 RepID=A0ABS5S9Q8_9FLAO|nr:hypothetical protein [Aequorivita echinoideorum]MBT0609149.1 hypothetical protein [Aequorivita echinoideorum]